MTRVSCDKLLLMNHQLYFFKRRLQLFSPLYFAHHPLCGNYRREVFQVGHWFICRGCTCMYSSTLIMFIMTLLFNPFTNFSLFEVFFLILGVTSPSWISLICSFQNRIIKDFIRISLGLGLGIALAELLLQPLWTYKIIILACIFIFHIIFVRIRRLQTDKRHVKLCSNCVELDNHPCVGFKSQFEAERLYLQEINNILQQESNWEHSKLTGWILGILGICRPFWAFFLTYCYFVFVFMVAEQKTVFSISLGFFSMFFFYLGHFSLNAIYDREYDRQNPRKGVLNSWNEDLGVTVKWIWSLIGLFWMVSLFLSLFHMIVFNKILPIFIFLAILFAITYSVPPLYLKGRSPWDIIINVISFGILGPLYAIELISGLNSINILNLLVILLFSSSTLIIVVLPTIIMDTNTDNQFGLNTFSVRYGKNTSINIIKIGIVFQAISLLGISWEFFSSDNYIGLIVVAIFFLGESVVLSPLFYGYLTDEGVELVVNNLFYFFLTGSTFLLGFVLITRIIDLNLNILIQEIIDKIQSALNLNMFLLCKTLKKYVLMIIIH